MKVTFALVFTVYVLYNAVYNNNNNYAGTIVKRAKTDFSRKKFYNIYRKKRRFGTNNTNTARYTLLIRMLLVCGCVECHPGPITCPTCGASFNRASRLALHEANANPSQCDQCPRLFCNEARLQQHKTTVHIGGGTVATTARANPYPIDLDTEIVPDSGHTETAKYQEKINEHLDVIRNRTIEKQNYKTINRQLPSTYTYGDLKRMLDEVKRNEVGVFKINLGFGSMLYDTIDKTYRYFYVSTNHYLFDRAYTISSNRDMSDFFNKILSVDLAENYYFKRPSSGWILTGLPNIEIKIMRLRGIPIGAGVQLPDHIKRSKSIVGLTHDFSNKHPFLDNLCFFRCLTLFSTPPEQELRSTLRSLERPANDLKRQLEQHTDKSYDEGVEVDTLPIIEDFFDITINVYALQEDKTAKVIYISERDTDDNIMYLNLFENHFSYISKFKSYAKKYQCPNCTRFITRTDSLKRHMKKCQIEVEEIFIGGKCRNKKTVFELLEDINIHVPKEDRFDEYFTTYDFEALQAPIDEEHQGRSLHYEHVPATVSICSSVPEHTEPVHIRSRGEPQELVDDFVQELLKVQTTREVLLTTKYQPYINELTEKRSNWNRC